MTAQIDPPRFKYCTAYIKKIHIQWGEMKSVKENAQLGSAMCWITASMPHCGSKNPTPRSMCCNSALYYDKIAEKK